MEGRSVLTLTEKEEILKAVDRAQRATEKLNTLCRKRGVREVMATFAETRRDARILYQAGYREV
jgi:hypothetical protein